MPDEPSAPRAFGTHTTFRLAIGLFSDLAALRDALSSLSERGLAAHSYCLVSLAKDPETCPIANAESLAASDIGAYFAQSQIHSGYVCHTDDAGARCASYFASQLTESVPATWLSPAQSKRLQDHLQVGGYVLIVSSRTPDEQDGAIRILLRHSRNGVQTHDFTLRADALTP